MKHTFIAKNELIIYFKEKREYYAKRFRKINKRKNRLVLKQPLPALLSIITFRQKKRFFWHYFRGSMTYGQPISDRFSKNMK